MGWASLAAAGSRRESRSPLPGLEPTLRTRGRVCSGDRRIPSRSEALPGPAPDAGHQGFSCWSLPTPPPLSRLLKTFTTVLFPPPPRGVQILASVFLYLGAIIVGITSYYMADRKHRKAFLEARQSLEVKMNLEEQSQQQVRLFGGAPGSGAKSGRSELSAAARPARVVLGLVC